jgi:hypothetical protein
MQASALVRLREPEVRVLCSGAAFNRGDAWQRAGHVGNRTVYTDGLSADVRGTWRQVERVTVNADAKGVHTSCTCGAGEYCRHAAALLLQWVRVPRSFAQRVPETYGDPLSLDEAIDLDLDLIDEVELPDRDEFAALLEVHTMTDLREIARRRGVRGGGRNKVELAAALTVSLADPANIDAALATLADDERAMLLALYLIDLEPNSWNAMGSAYRTISGETDPMKFTRALDKLVRLGLAFPSGEPNRVVDRHIIPQVVATRISLTGSPLLRLVQAAGRTDGVPPPADRSGLTLSEVLLVVVHEAACGRIGKELPTLPPGATIVTTSGWMSEAPPTADRTARVVRSQGTELTLVPQPSLFSDADLRHLAARTGAPVETIDFAIELLDELEILTYTGQGKSTHAVVNEQVWSALLPLPPSARTMILTETWLSMFAAFDFRGISPGGKRLELHTLQLPYYAPLPTGGPRSDVARILMTRLLLRLAVDDPEGRWYDLPSWLDILWTFTPDLLGKGAATVGEWWFRGMSGHESRLNLEDRAGWQEIWEPLIQSMLLGPLTWLGLVETSRQSDDTLSFRPRPEVAVLLQERPEEVVPSSGPSLSLGVDPSTGAPEVLVPAGYSDLPLHVLLLEIADLADVSPGGLRYRLSRQRAQDAFDGGVTGPDLLRILAERASGSMPVDVRTVIDAWWKDYGNVRLYDDLTLIELGDDILLQELLATSSLRNVVVEVVTPRLVAIDPAAIRPLLGEMERLGYTPRVVAEV